MARCSLFLRRSHLLQRQLALQGWRTFFRDAREAGRQALASVQAGVNGLKPAATGSGRGGDGRRGSEAATGDAATVQHTLRLQLDTSLGRLKLEEVDRVWL